VQGFFQGAIGKFNISGVHPILVFFANFLFSKRKWKGFVSSFKEIFQDA